MPGGQGPQRRQKFVYHSLSGGISSVLPYGTQLPGQGEKILVDAQNMIWHRGALRPAWDWTRLDQSAHVNPTIHGNIASRQYTASTNAQYVVAALLFSTSTSTQQAYVVLTDGEIFVNGVSMNPTYSAGTSTYDGTGTTTAWDARGIKQGDLFKLDSDTIWRVVTTVTSDTALTLSSNPGTGSGAYVIRRTFKRGVIPGTPSMALLNNDLYVACENAGQDPAGSPQSHWCVLKVADIFGTPTTATYVLSTWDTTGALPAKSIVPGITKIMGIQATEDGRLVLAVEQDGAGNRIMWCAVNDTADWDSAEDANYSDMVPSHGEIRAFSKIGRSLCAYFVDSIFTGTPTGDTLFPFNFHRSRAAIGTRWQRAVVEVPDGNLYVGSDFRFYLFDGDRERPLTDATLRRWMRGPDEQYLMQVEGDVAAAIAEGTASVGTVVVA